MSCQMVMSPSVGQPETPSEGLLDFFFDFIA